MIVCSLTIAKFESALYNLRLEAGILVIWKERASSEPDMGGGGEGEGRAGSWHLTKLRFQLRCRTRCWVRRFFY
jgi:hypothetical protein